MCWRDGDAAAVVSGPLSRLVRPDAWFVYRLGEVVLVGLVEVDRGTERGRRSWVAKLDAYQSLFSDRAALVAATGYMNARVLVLTPSSQRLNGLVALLDDSMSKLELPPAILDRFWLAEQPVLACPDLTEARWRRPGSDAFWSLVSKRTY